jgi:O-antigen/teichoic acid export membrane protein
LIYPYRPGLSFDKTHLQALFKYTGGVAGLPILTFIFMRADVFVISKLCSPAELGLYSMATAIAHLPLQFMGRIIAPVIMPAFTEIQADKARINATILKVTAIITFLMVPLLVCAILYGKNLLLLAYGPQYSKAAVPFAIILGTSVLQTICVPVVTFYLAIGRPALHRLFAAIRTALIVALIYPATKHFGLIGAAGAGLIAMSFGYLFQVMWMHEIIQLDLRKYGLIFLRALAVSSCIVVLWFFTHNLFPSRPLLNVLPGAAGCLLAYAFAAMILLPSKSGVPILSFVYHPKQV